MGDRFFPLPMEQLSDWLFRELESERSAFGIPEELFHVPAPDDPFCLDLLGVRLETPVGVASGPHAQLAQNLVSAYLCGARVLELKTVQTLDRLSVRRPCIDAEDLCYNCEWSQELRLEQSFEEYLKAWILLHALEQRRGSLRPSEHGFLFQMSVGYNLEGIRRDNVQRFLARMRDSRGPLRAALAAAGRARPELLELAIPERLSSSVTLSTMHGCPPEEIERIGLYLIEELGLHTAVKLNPTLLGRDAVSEILHSELRYDDVQVPDSAFAHDPRFEDAVLFLRTLGAAARRRGLTFSVKLSNTLETVNLRGVLPTEEAVHYLSGRALHPLVVQLASDLDQALGGEIPIAFAGGADEDNLAELLGAGLRPVTLCTDLLKPGGYGRLGAALSRLKASMRALGADDLDALARAQAAADPARAARVQALLGTPCDLRAHSRAAARANLEAYAREARASERYRKQDGRAALGRAAFGRPRALPSAARENTPVARFDCVRAPCQEACPAHQRVPEYMRLASEGRFDESLAVVRDQNPWPATTGQVCDHPCAPHCVRRHYDAAVRIREVKRAVATLGRSDPRPPLSAIEARPETRVAIVGAGPAGLTAAELLIRSGLSVTVFEAGTAPGGVPAQNIPVFRLPAEVLERDIAPLQARGARFEFGVEVGAPGGVALEDLRGEHAYVILCTGAGRAAKLCIPGEDAPGVQGCLEYLAKVRAPSTPALGRRVLVIGGGNAAVDAARSARRGGASVALVYRRSRAEMPAADEEIESLAAEEIRVFERLAPVRVVTGADGRVRGLECLEVDLLSADPGGRRRPVPRPGTERILEADAILVAIGQAVDPGPLAEGLRRSSAGSLWVDPATGETSLSNVFGAGDLVRGAASIIEAIADGRRAALEILAREGLAPPEAPPVSDPRSAREHLVRRARRMPPAPLPEAGPAALAAWAQAEAGRCLGCDSFCSLCVTVCPNRAQQIYTVTPFEVRLPVFELQKGALVRTGEESHAIRLAHQIVHLADWCNECGNCATFCPAGGAPYREKPHLCFDLASLAEEVRAVHFQGSGLALQEPEGRHRLRREGRELHYEGPCLEAILDARSLSVKKIAQGPNAVAGARLDLGVCLELIVLHRGLSGAPFAPRL